MKTELFFIICIVICVEGNFSKAFKIDDNMLMGLKSAAVDGVLFFAMGYILDVKMENCLYISIYRLTSDSY